MVATLAYNNLPRFIYNDCIKRHFTVVIYDPRVVVYANFNSLRR